MLPALCTCPAATVVQSDLPKESAAFISTQFWSLTWRALLRMAPCGEGDLFGSLFGASLDTASIVVMAAPDTLPMARLLAPVNSETLLVKLVSALLLGDWQVALLALEQLAAAQAKGLRPPVNRWGRGRPLLDRQNRHWAAHTAPRCQACLHFFQKFKPPLLLQQGCHPLWRRLAAAAASRGVRPL